MAVIDPYRAAAVKALLARIDNNRNQYNSKPKQNDMLRDLIKSNNLETYVGRGGQQLAGLTVERFHKIIEDVTKRHVRGNKDARSNSTHLFEQGSAVVEAAYLDKIGYSGECEEAANGAIELSSDDDISDIEIPTKKRKHAASNKQEKKIRQQTKMLQETDRDSSDPSAEVSGLGNSRKRKDGPSSSRSEEPRKKTKMTEELTANPSEQIVDPNFAAIINGNANGDTRKCKAGPFDFNEDEHRKKMRMTADSEVNSPEVIGNRDSAANADENVAGVQSNTDTNKVASMVSPAQEPAINRPSADVSHPRSGIDTSSSTLTTAALPSTTTVPTTAIPMTTIPTAIAQNADNEASGLKRRAADSADEARDPKKQKTGAEPENSSQTRSAAAQTDLDDPYALKDPRMRIVVEGIESRDLLQKLDVLAHKSQGFGLQVLIRTGKEWTAAAEWVPNPSNELRDLYRRALGNAWEDQALVLSQSGEFKAYELIQALITAEWDKILFHEKLPWPSPREMTEAMAHIEPYFDAMNAEQALRTSLWRASAMRFKNNHFQETEIRPIARERARKFMLVLQPQMSALGATKPGAGQEPREFCTNLTELATRVFETAFIAKGLLVSSKHPHEHRWYQSGTELDFGTMEEIPEWNAPGRVKLTVRPEMWVRQFGADKCHFVCKAEVIRFREL